MLKFVKNITKNNKAFSLKIVENGVKINKDTFRKRRNTNTERLIVETGRLGGLILGERAAVPFYGTKEQEAQLLAMISELKSQKGALMPILQRAQDIYGYLPKEVQQIISDETGIPMSKIYGVVTFYSQFNLYPKGKYQISVCLGTACYVKGAGDIFERIKERLGIEDGECTPDGKFSLDACRCIGACGLAPVIMINDKVYGRLTVEDVDRILAEYKD